MHFSGFLPKKGHFSKRDTSLSRLFLFSLIFLLGFFQPLAVIAQDTLQSSSTQGIFVAEEPSLSYGELMREYRSVKAGKGKSTDDDRKRKLAGQLKRFLKKEKERAGILAFADSKKQAYFGQLEAQIHGLGETTGFLDGARQFVKKIVLGRGVGEQEGGIAQSADKKPDIPDHPAQFSFPNEIPELKTLNEAVVQAKKGIELPAGLKDAITIEEVEASDTILPTSKDLSWIDPESVVSFEIQNTAKELNRNPVAIFNYLYNEIKYEPYWGAKKGATGCLRERVCNDVDTASLAVALFRANGIPAHYKKGIAVVPVRTVTTLLGVDDAKTAFGVLAVNHVPVYVLSSALDGTSWDKADFSQEKFFAVEWVYPEIFFEYDERGANVSNALQLELATSTEAIQKELAVFPKKEWIPVDSLFKPLTHTKGVIAPDQTAFAAKTFWRSYLSYQGISSPLARFVEEVKGLSGKDVFNASNQSSFSLSKKQFPILPPSLPFALAQGEVKGVPLLPETWEMLPEARRTQVSISLLKADTKNEVFKKTFFGSEINNSDATLHYEGLGDQDAQTIGNYGGIHLTPSTLVDIKPVLEVGHERFAGSQPLKIGEQLILKFTYLRNGETAVTNEKFSVAGNQEGIVIVLSRVMSDPSLNGNSKILLAGNTGLARTFLERVAKDADTLSAIYDHPYTTEFMRAVVTQNRILTEVNNTPTTFDFKGLTMDASSHITDYSARNEFSSHQSDFRLMFGLTASYYESEHFKIVTGLDGISTVRGLQIASAKPDAYRIITIGKENKSDLDSLELSENTKANMRKDIDEGAEIITADKLIAEGAWSGVLYTSIKPDGTGQYAIGEQSIGNGGWTTNQMIWEEERDEDSDYLDWHVSAPVPNTQEKFLYKDLKNEIDSVYCRISEAEFNDIQSDSGWEKKYGIPCFRENRFFGTTGHSYVLASDGAKFSSSARYDYWISRKEVRAILEQDRYRDNRQNFAEITLDKTFKFNPIAGTYSWAGGHWDSGGKNLPGMRPLTAYYQPLPDKRGRGNVVYGSILRKLESSHYKPINQCLQDDPYCAKRNYVLDKLGFPTENRNSADMYWPNFFEQLFRSKVGYYQTFAGGQVYVYGEDEFLVGNKDTWYVPEPIARVYNSEELCQQEKNGNKHCGSGGAYGFPAKDPVLLGDGVTINQEFENGHGIFKRINQSSETGFDYAVKYRCDGKDQNSEVLTGQAFLEGLNDSGSEELKSALLFIGLPVAAGLALDAFFGTHGAISIALGATMGFVVVSALVALNEVGIDSVLGGVKADIAIQTKSATCNSRKSYLLARYSPQFIFFMLDMKSFVNKGAKEAGDMARMSALLATRASKKLSEMPKTFRKSLTFFEKVLYGGKDDVETIAATVQRKLDTELAFKTRLKGAPLTSSEIESIASKVFVEAETKLPRLLGWRKLTDDIKDNTTKHPLRTVAKRFKVTNDGYLDLDLGVFAKDYQREYASKDLQINIAINEGSLYFGPVDAKTLKNGTKAIETTIHPQLVEGIDVDFAGAFMVRFDATKQAWKVIRMSNFSGHYGPDIEQLRLLDYYFVQSGVKMDGVKVDAWITDQKILVGDDALDYATWVENIN